MKTSQKNQSELATALMKYLDCPCRYFEPMEKDDEIMTAYREAQKRGEAEGFTPMLITVDEILWECLVMNSAGENNGFEDYHFNSDQVAAYRKSMLNMPVKAGMESLAQYLDELQKTIAEEDIDWDEEVLGEEEEANNGFHGYWDYRTRNTCPMILAEIPVKHPWEIFAYLPFGGWNECPDTPTLMAVAKYWFESHGAVPAVITHDVLEFILPTAVDRVAATALAAEQFVFCSDIVEQSDLSLGMLANLLTKSNLWYFWWD